MSDDKLPWLGLLLLAPLIALVIVGASALSVFTGTGARIASAEAVGEFAARSAVALDDLQRERANATSWLISGSDASRQIYENSWDSFERTTENLFALFEPGSPHAAQFRTETRESMRLSLLEVQDLRPAVLEQTVSVEQALNAYTDALNHFIDVMALELSRATGAQARFTGAFVVLCRFHDRYAEEVGAGLFAYGAGEISHASHGILLKAIGAQDGHLAAFHSLADPQWDRQLYGLIARAEPEILSEARGHLIAAGYGAPLDETHRVWWRETRLPIYFELSTLRNRFAQEGVREALAETQARRDEAMRNAAFQLLLIMLATLVAGYAARRITRTPPQADAAPDADAAADALSELDNGDPSRA
ncbi:MAG: nitrate- and nitrite sensing domain-containing protein [Oceanicaulis sp.]|nr:nitrate- and nitrite sensing domain-containing protein [Oceanicaulis sp.]